MEQSELSELIRIGLVMAFFPLVLGMGLLYMWRERKLQHEERRLMIEKGLTPPPAPVHWPQVKQRENELRFEERRLMIEKGLLTPDDFGDQKRRRDGLHGGVLWFCLGLGLGITYYLLPETSGGRGFLALASPALAMFGLACVINYGLSRTRTRRRSDEAQP